MKKFLFGILIVLVVVAVGCSKDTTTSSDGVPTIRWVQIGNGMPRNYDAWEAHVNEYIEEKIGARIKMEVISWGDFKTRRSVIVNTNENYDIIFSDHGTFPQDVAIGAYADITEKVKTVTPDLYNMIPTDYWKAVSVNGAIYGVPTYKDSSFTNYFVWVQDYIDRYNFDPDAHNSFASLTDILLEIKETESITPYILGSDAPNPASELYDSFGTGLPTMGVAYDDESRTVVSVFEQSEVLAELEVLHDWYNKGIINSDAATLAEAPRYRVLKIAQGWKTAAKTTWGPQMGVEAYAVQRNPTLLSNETVQGSVNSINASSPNIDKALQLLELLNTDTYLRDAFYYGLEGDDFEYTPSGKVRKINKDWAMAGYSQGTFFNITQQEGTEVDQWAEVKQLNESALPSVMLGFSMDLDPVEDEIANCNTIWNKYRLQLVTGAGEPRSTIEAMMKEMRLAGFDEILAEAQRQIDAYF